MWPERPQMCTILSLLFKFDVQIKCMYIHLKSNIQQMHVYAKPQIKYMYIPGGPRWRPGKRWKSRPLTATCEFDELAA